MTILLESKARPYGSTKGMAISMVVHGALIAAAIFATTKVVLPPREKIEEHPVLYVATPPPKPLVVPEPLPAVKTPPRAKAPVRQQAPRLQPTPPVKTATIPALVAPSRVPVNLPAIDLKAMPTIGEVVVPVAADAINGGVSTGAAKAAGENSGLGSGGVGSGDAGRAYSENQVDRAVEVLRSPSPRYPDALKSVGVQGIVVMRFVVSAEGRVESGSIQVISSPHKLFAAAVRTALLDTRYRPAEAGGRSVRQLVEQSFSFTLKN